MNPENNSRHKFTLSRIYAHAVHGAGMPNLIRPVISDYFIPTPDFAWEFTTAFIYILLTEGDNAVEYIQNIPEPDKKRLIRVLEQGGIGDTEYLPSNTEGSP